MTLPVLNGPPPKLIQTQYARLAVNVTTTVVLPLFTTLLSLTIQTRGGTRLIIHCEAALNTSFGVALDSISQALRLDGVFLQAMVSTLTPQIETAAMTLEEPLPPAVLAAGVHTVLFSFAKFAASPAVVNCFAGTLPQGFSANLLVHEVVSP